jgi:dUTP pyrophosphatase
MDKSEIESYLKRLQQLDEQLTDDEDEIDENSFISELNKVLGGLSNDVQSELIKTNGPTINGSMKVNIQKLTPEAVIPTYSKDGDAGMDLTITREIENTSFQVTYGFGIAMEIPKGYVGLVFPRSSIRNFDLLLTNSVGVIDSGYRGEIQATFKKTNGLDSIKYKVGERGAQIVILPYPQIEFNETNKLSSTERGEGGFGSTGK